MSVPKIGKKPPASKASVPSSPFFFYGWVIAAVCTLTKIGKCPGQNNIMTYTVPHLQEELQLSDGELGALFSVATLSASCVQPRFGRIVDRFGARACVPAAHMCLCLSLLCFSQARRFAQMPLKYAEVVVLFFFLRALSLGALEIFPSACIQKWFVRRRGRALSIVAMLQNVGNGIVGPAISELVLASGWRTAAQAGALTNLALVPCAALLLRRSPEDCGLAPDGGGGGLAVPAEEPDEPCKDPEAAGAGAGSGGGVAAAPQGDAEEAAADSEPPPLPRGAVPIFVFAFFYALMFGGCDFDMVSMVAEAGGEEGGVSVAAHVFMPLALTAALATPLIGELMDGSSQGPAFTFSLMGLCGLVTCFVTNLLCFTKTPLIGVIYGVARGLSNAIFMTLCTSGMAFAALGVSRDHIGGVLGINQFATIAGTGFGPLVYGVAKDSLGSFRLSLQLSSLPPLFLGILFIVRALQAQDNSQGPPEETSETPAARQPAAAGGAAAGGAVAGEVSPVLGKSLNEAEAGTRVAASVGVRTPKVSDSLLAAREQAVEAPPEARQEPVSAQ